MLEKNVGWKRGRKMEREEEKKNILYPVKPQEEVKLYIYHHPHVSEFNIGLFQSFLIL